MTTTLNGSKMLAVAEQAAGGHCGMTRNALSALTAQLGMDDFGELAGILKETVMPKASDAELGAFALVCSSYKLNPLTREVYAFPTKNGGIMPMIGIDGWLKIAHQHADYAGMAWAEGVEADGDRWCECTVWLRSTPEHPVTIREYLSECRQNTPVWGQRPKRMLRHRATIQAIRYALGISGVSDSEDWQEQGMHGGEPVLRDVTPRGGAVAAAVVPAGGGAAGRGLVAAVPVVPVAGDVKGERAAAPEVVPAVAPAAAAAVVPAAVAAAAAAAVVPAAVAAEGVLPGMEVVVAEADEAALALLNGALAKGKRRLGDLVMWCRRNGVQCPEMGAPRAEVARFAGWLLRQDELLVTVEQEFGVELR